MSTDQHIEKRIQSAGKTAPRLTPDHIDAQIATEQFYVFPGTCMTVCLMTLKNGYHTLGRSAPVSPENFDEDIGREIARRNARDEIWALEGYMLRQKLHDAAPHGRDMAGAPLSPSINPYPPVEYPEDIVVIHGRDDKPGRGDSDG